MITLKIMAVILMGQQKRHIVKIIIIILDQATGSRTMDKIVLKITHQTS